jgi:hypothetical protein
MQAQTPQAAAITRPEQKKSDHDLSDIFSATKARPSSNAFQAQPDQGKIPGFDFCRDPLNAPKSRIPFEQGMMADIAISC